MLWTSQAISEFAYSTSLIALPLLVLTITGSPSQAGIIAFIDATAMLAAGLPAGAIADRYDRRTVLLGCETTLTLTFGIAALFLWVGPTALTMPVLVLLALANGVATAVALATSEAMVPALVPPESLSNAVAMNSVRTYAGQLAGTSAGGVLQAVKNALPFLIGSVAHALSLLLLVFLRPQPARPREPIRRWSAQELLDGVRWIAGKPFLRLGLWYATVTNFFYGVVFFVVIASAKTSGMSSGLVGIMAALLGVGGLAGALAVPVLRRVLSGSRPIFVVLWLFAATTVGIAVVPGSYTPGVLLGITAFVAPSASAYFVTYQLQLTPDSHRGRVMSVANLCGGGGAAIAPLVGGVALEVSGRLTTLLVCGVILTVVALSAVLSQVMRHPPPLPGEGKE